jgi:ATP-dependent helicase YprA (DUF1998 family)
MANLTLAETVDELHRALREYIEATYHIGDPRLVAQRRRLLDEPGVIRQAAYVESTPRYETGEMFENLGLPDAALEILLTASRAEIDGNPLVRNPSYAHQAASLRALLVEGRSLMVATAAGSGKTECFLLPLLGSLANEAASSPDSFGVPALRAMILYPMNALVNDQLGRLRLLFGNESVAGRFIDWAGRPARFARYTSRTLYPGVRTAKRDQRRLRPIGEYYVKTLRSAIGDSRNHEATQAETLRSELHRRGKWPAKPNLLDWYGGEGTRWRDSEGRFKRCVTLPHDPELLTRHEVLDAPPDLLVTNYSMLEYMLMRPLERPVFDATKGWLERFPEQRFILVVDEAHLYRGASGTEVGLLLRRLRDRLGISEDRLKVVCTSASFDDVQRAAGFAALLTGKEPGDFRAVRGDLDLRAKAASGEQSDAEVLAAVDLDAFYSEDDPHRQLEILRPLLNLRGVEDSDPRIAVYQALDGYPPMDLLVNKTMQGACRVQELAGIVFPTADPEVAERASTTLVALGSFAREAGQLDGSGLLPSRVHAFFRGLPGLWVCLDATCAQLENADRGGYGGKLYGQPQRNCRCGARVLELFTCRHCGSPYARGYTDSLDSPTFLWSEPGQEFVTPTGEIRELYALDILLAEPASQAAVRPADLDVVTGRLDPREMGPRTRRVHLPQNDYAASESATAAMSGVFKPCAVCLKQAAFGRSSVQDHQTKGDEPFRALVTRQVEVQQPTVPASRFAPLGGRKVLVFSDSRQTAARLAPNLQKYTTRDAIRPLLVYGFDLLTKELPIRRRLSLEDCYLAILIASARLEVRLRPPTRIGESFAADLEEVRNFLHSGGLDDVERQLDLMLDFRGRNAPEYLLRAIFDVVNDQYYGLASLALGTLVETEQKRTVVDELPELSGLDFGRDQKQAILRLWLSAWRGQWLHSMPTSWASTVVWPESGSFTTRFKRFFSNRAAEKSFQKLWVPKLLQAFAEPVESKFRLRGSAVTLELLGSWAYCQTCRSSQRPFPGLNRCTECGRESVRVIDPDTDSVFVARKGYFRRDTIRALHESQGPLALIAAEHTAQLNDAQADEIFSEAEEHELLFQDVDLGRGQPAIDVLSCTTTMEVGIDIGSLSGVALRNMPPSRANYQQRAGRAGRRGRAVATVTAFASADSHDEHCFIAPDEMIRGAVIDPELNLDNRQITRRHLTAFILQEYLQDRLPPQPPVADEDADQASPYGTQLFEVLGTVDAFKLPDSPLNRSDFADWLRSEAPRLLGRAQGWLPSQLAEWKDANALLGAILDTSQEVDRAINGQADLPETSAIEESTPAQHPAEGTQLEVPAQVGEEQPSADPSGETLLDRLLYQGVLPRYAFPTDVAAFHVFNSVESSAYRPVFQYTPSQGLSIALSQYAPGKTVWIGGKEWRSGAIYSPMTDDRFQAWNRRRLYLECGVCHFAMTVGMDGGSRGERRDCPACGTEGELGPAKTWLRPPGFAHPWYWDEGTSPDDEPATSYATRAKLTAPTPADAERWLPINERIRSYFDRAPLLVTNTGPRNEGYAYCTKCGLIEPNVTLNPAIVEGHRKPFPDARHPLCQGAGTTHGLVLGTDFISDVLLVSMRVESPLTLRPEYESTRVALRTLSEALTTTACVLIGIDPAELQAEFRPALTPRGRDGNEFEIYIYDTLPGGAGFSQRVSKMGLPLFGDTLKRLETCPAQCDSSCYRCLRSYRNKLDHDLLDRHVGASLLRFLLTSARPTLDSERAAISTALVFEDLQRQGFEGVTFEMDAKAEVPGFGSLTAPILARLDGGRAVVIVLHLPFAPSVPVAAEWAGPAEYGISPQVLQIDELAVRRNLPRVSAQIIEALGLE